MGKVDAAAIATLKALWETGDYVLESSLVTFIDMLADAAEDHGHTAAGGPGSETGDAGAVVNLQSGLAAAKPATPAVGDIYVETDTATVYACYVAEAWVQLGREVPYVHGVDRHTNVARYKFIPPTQHTDASVTSYLAYAGVLLVNNQSRYVYFTFAVPDDFVSLLSVKALWLCSNAGGNIYWQLNAVYAAHSETASQHTDAPALAATANLGADLLNSQAPANPLSLSNLAKGDTLSVLLYRVPTDDLDTITGDLYLLGLTFAYTAEQ